MNLTRFSLNAISLIGTVSRIGEAVTNQQNQPFVEFDLVTNDRFRVDQNRWKEIPEYHHCNVIGKQAEQFLNCVTVGSYLWARGSVKTVSNAQSNKEKLATRIHIKEWSILSQADIDQISPSQAMSTTAWPVKPGGQS